jgi:hypothetical protein
MRRAVPAGKYMVADIGSQGPPVYSTLTITAGKTGSLPSTPTTVTAANPSKDKYKWEISGALKPGANQVTFDSKGKEALHFIGAFKLKSKASKAQILKALKSQGKPPPFVDQGSFYNTAAIDGRKSQTTPLQLRGGPGEYVLFCPLTDRDETKPHFEQGLLTTISVK